MTFFRANAGYLPLTGCKTLKEKISREAKKDKWGMKGTPLLIEVPLYDHDDSN